MSGSKIQKGKVTFLLGIDKPEQLLDWLRKNKIHGVAFVGRSNVGKSSLINTVFGPKTARVSKTPGRTRQVNVFAFEIIDENKQVIQTSYLFDLPGYGHADVSRKMQKTWQELMDTFFHYCRQKVLLLNIQDARHPLQDSDQDFHEYIREFRLETYLVFNKIDKLKTQKERAELKKIMPKIYDQFSWVKQIHFTSAEKKDGTDALELAIINFLARFYS